ncbi:MAG TPA: PilZ domain-containing protein [Candidatus Binatia bacterium]|nr:PilZ domain-containing protein [Candidatus Binatia bacterium]
MSPTPGSDAVPTTPWEEISAQARRDRRSEPRLSLPYPVQVYGFDGHGQYFMERTTTLNVSPCGCMLELSRQPETHGVLAVRRVGRDGAQLEGQKPVLFEICWVQRSGRHWYVGAKKLQSCDLWGLSAPGPVAGT